MNDFLKLKLFEIGSYSFKVSNLVYLLLFFIIIFIFLVILKRMIYRSKKIEPAKKFSVYKLTQYLVIIISLIVGLRILGLDLTLLLAGSAALLVGLGFGLQHLFNDFISGIILLLDGTIKMGDIIEVNETTYKVQDVNFRTTTLIGRDEDYVILPNSELTSNKVVNWTHSNISSRFNITFGIDYSTDIDLLMIVVKEVVMNHPKILKQPEPFVRFTEFGDSAMIFKVFFYSDEIFRIERIKGEVRVDIFKALKANNINIPLPQRVVHHRND